MSEYSNRRNIKLDSVDDVEEFVSAAEKCDFTINVCRNQYHFVVDGKSLMGMLAIFAGGILDVVYDGENAVFDRMLEKFQCVAA